MAQKRNLNTRSLTHCKTDTDVCVSWLSFPRNQRMSPIDYTFAVMYACNDFLFCNVLVLLKHHHHHHFCCPQTAHFQICRLDVEYVRRNPTVENVVDKYLSQYPEKKRPDDEYKLLKEKNKINSDILKLNEGKGKGKKKAAPVQPRAASVPAAPRGRGR